jgi:hypothetical protein
MGVLLLFVLALLLYAVAALKVRPSKPLREHEQVAGGGVVMTWSIHTATTTQQQNWMVGYGADAPAGPYSWPLVGILPRVLVNSDRILELNQEAHLQVHPSLYTLLQHPTCLLRLAPPPRLRFGTTSTT